MAVRPLSSLSTRGGVKNGVNGAYSAGAQQSTPFHLKAENCSRVRSAGGGAGREDRHPEVTITLGTQKNCAPLDVRELRLYRLI